MPCLSVIIAHCFTCGERKVVKHQSQNMKMIEGFNVLVLIKKSICSQEYLSFRHGSRY